MGLGLLNSTMAFCLMSAFNHLAVGLAVLIFYLYPVLTGLGAWLLRQEALNRGILIGLGRAVFVGLALALGDTNEEASMLGMALAGCAALLMTGVVLLSARVLANRQRVFGYPPYAYLGLAHVRFYLPDSRRFSHYRKRNAAGSASLPFLCFTRLP